VANATEVDDGVGGQTTTVAEESQEAEAQSVEAGEEPESPAAAEPELNGQTSDGALPSTQVEPATDATRAPAETDYRLINRTVCELGVRIADGRLTIPPLSACEVPAGAVAQADLRVAEAARVLRVEEVRPRQDPVSDSWFATAFVAGFFGVVGTIDSHTLANRIFFACLIAVSALTALMLLLWRLHQLSGIANVARRLPRRLAEHLYLTAVTVIVLVVPGAILYLGSDVHVLYRLATRDGPGHHGAVVSLIGIAVQWICIVGASALPMVLYFVFDREKLRTLREKFERQIFRLDPAVTTMADVEAKYGKLLDETYGRHSDNRLLPGRRFPILIAASVVTLGWTIALLDTNAASLGNGATLTRLLEPTPTATTFAFLGAYFFALNHILRGYVRGDLRPKTYAHVAVRIVGVVVLAFVLEHLVAGFGGKPSNAALLVLAFVTGIVPETVLVWLREVSRSFAGTREGRASLARFAQTYEAEPLTQLEGIDIYDRARLLDEGVTNVEGLAHHDLVELLLRTRIPASRLVDWVDQAILYIHCSGCSGGDAADDSPAFARLRAHGIRTATDLEHAYRKAVSRKEEARFLAIVPPRGNVIQPLRPILDALTDEDWMHNLRHWHRQAAKPRLLRIPEDFVGSRATCAPEPGDPFAANGSRSSRSPQPV
jgi:hypothetical protein